MAPGCSWRSKGSILHARGQNSEAAATSQMLDREGQGYRSEDQTKSTSKKRVTLPLQARATLSIKKVRFHAKTRLASSLSRMGDREEESTETSKVSQ